MRVHSSCLTGDVFGSVRCECGPQLEGALERITAEPGGGLLVYMAGHEGRGIGLWAKAATYLLQDAGEDTYQANRSLGLPDDSRDFTDAGALLHHFVGDKPMRLLTNNPKKVQDLTRMGLDAHHDRQARDSASANAIVDISMRSACGDTSSTTPISSVAVPSWTLGQRSWRGADQSLRSRTKRRVRHRFVRCR